MFVYPDPPNLLIYLVTYLPRRDRFTHEDFVVGRKLRRVVVHVFDFDVNAHFGVLVVTPCTHTHSRLKMMSVLLRTKKIQSSVKFITDQNVICGLLVIACLSAF